MKKVIILLLSLVLSSSLVTAQPTQAEIDKMIKEAQAEIDKAKKDPKTAEMSKNLPDLEKIMKDLKNNSDPAVVAAMNKTAKSGSRTIPPKNNKLLLQLPKKPLTGVGLAAYIKTLHAQLFEKIKSSSVNSARLKVAEIGNNGEELAGAAILAWYNSDAEVSVLLAMQAATLSLNDNTSLNNCAAILTLAGLENKAIPILQVLLLREPSSSTVLNNLGQAYAGLGDAETAMLYFGRCIQIAPQHPEANNTAAIICMQRGQTEAAQNHCLQALQGGLTGDAIQSYRVLFPGKDYSNEVNEKPYSQYPFNEHDFRFPQQCLTVDNAIAINDELKALADMYRSMHDKMENGIIGENLSIVERMAAEIGNKPLEHMELADAETIFTRRATYAYTKIIIPLSEQVFELTTKHGLAILRIDNEYRENRDNLSKSHRAESNACDQNNACQDKVRGKYCRLFNELSNQYLPRYAAINGDFVRTRWRLHKEMFEALSVYARVAFKRGTMLKAAKEAERLAFIMSPLINGTILNDGYKILFRDPLCGDMTDEEAKKLEDLVIKENYQCNLNVSLRLAKGYYVKFSCDEFQIEGGTGIRFKYNKNFRSGQTTLYGGVGGNIPGPGIGVSQYVYVCFDRNGQPVDGGTESILHLPGEDTKFRTSINNGATFEPGILKPLTDVLPYLFK